jgi:hypothetical protein
MHCYVSVRDALVLNAVKDLFVASSYRQNRRHGMYSLKEIIAKF